MDETKTIGKDYSLWQLAGFALPAVLNELVINLLYTIDDGLFISRYIGSNAMAAFSVLFPLFMIHNSPAILLGGVSTLASRKMGEGKSKEARADFTAMVLFVGAVGILLGVGERIFMDPILKLLGATEIIYPYARDFVKVGALYLPFTLVSTIFRRFYVPAGKPKMELLSTVLNVSTNLFFDWYYVVYKRVGMVGTAYANLLATLLMTVIGLLFYSNRKCEMQFTSPSRDLMPLIMESSKYGISSFLSNLSVGLSSLVSNYAILYWGSEEYLAAYTIVGNIQWAFMGCFFGLFDTAGPIISYAVGERNVEKLRKTFRQVIILTTFLSVALMISFLLFGWMVAGLYIAEGAKDYKDLITFGMKIAPYSFLVFGYNLGARITFASLGNHKTSAALTFMQEVVLANVTVVVLPLMFGITGVWFSFLLTNILMLFFSLWAVYVNRDNYGYGKSGLAQLIH
ncbi:MAG: hypothetical protein IJG59_05060 [Erysipelotrichaceae bacterium]|nr:hypothetical protein [Erysipelotrichaceae bacterium]